jgi:hypothetical protein
MALQRVKYPQSREDGLGSADSPCSAGPISLEPPRAAPSSQGQARHRFPSRLSKLSSHHRHLLLLPSPPGGEFGRWCRISAGTENTCKWGRGGDVEKRSVCGAGRGGCRRRVATAPGPSVRSSTLSGPRAVCVCVCGEWVVVGDKDSRAGTSPPRGNAGKSGGPASSVPLPSAAPVVAAPAGEERRRRRGGARGGGGGRGKGGEEDDGVGNPAVVPRRGGATGTAATTRLPAAQLSAEEGRRRERGRRVSRSPRTLSLRPPLPRWAIRGREDDDASVCCGAERRRERPQINPLPRDHMEKTRRV